MKKYILILIVVSTMLSACFKSTDEVKYNAINEVTLSDEKAGEEKSKLIVIDRLSTLTLKPEISQNIFKDESNLSYNWKIRENTVAQNPYPYIELGDTKNLEVPINVSVGIHRIIYTVTDKSTQISKFLYYNVKVIGEYSEGFTILEELPNGGDISMILPTGKVVRNIYSKQNGEMIPTPCVGLSVAIKSDPKKLFILSKEGGIETSYQEYTKLTDFENWFVSGTAPVGASVMPQLYTFTKSSHAGLINNFKLHARIGGGFPGDPAFGGAIPAPVESNGFRKDYMAAKFIVGGESNVYQIIYDNLEKRFLYLTLDGLTPCLKYFGLYESSLDAFNPANTELEMLHMDDSNVAYIHNALMRDKNNNLFILKFNSRSISTSTIRFATSKADVPSELNQFNVAISSKLLDHMYVAVENKIYHYDVPAKSVGVTPYQFSSSNERVVTMETINNNGVETLHVSTFDGTQGRVYYFELEPSGFIKDNNYKEKFEGFGKIVDMKYKN